jgi:hypothetical protein
MEKGNPLHWMVKRASWGIALFLVLVATVSTATTAIATVASTATAATVSTAVSTTAATATVTTTISTAAATATETTTVSTAAAAAFRARTCFVHHQVTTMEGLAVGALDARFASDIVGHLHKPEAAATVGGFVHNDLGRGHFTESFEKFAEILVLRGVRDVGDVNVHVVD